MNHLYSISRNEDEGKMTDNAWVLKGCPIIMIDRFILQHFWNSGGAIGGIGLVKGLNGGYFTVL
jgi:hypothetical protein